MAFLSRRNTTAGIDQEFLDDAADMGATRLDDYRLYEDYYRGEHKTKLTDRAKKYLQASGLQFCENFCEPITDVFAERLLVESFLAENKGDPSSTEQTEAQIELTKWLDSTLIQNRLDEEQRIVHTTTLIKGDGFVIVGWDEKRGRPVIAYNRPETIKASYSADDYRELEWASKTWVVKGSGSDLQRLNVYYPDRVERYYRIAAGGASGGWIPFEGGTQAWTDADGKPLGIPVVHFRHKHLARPDGYGVSELRNVIPQQDALNKQVIDLHDILDYQAWPQRYVSGVSKDSVTYKPQPGTFLQADDPQAGFGQFEAFQPSGVLEAIEQTISRIARRSRTPLHLLTGGDQPSGEALKSAESGLIAKATAAQSTFGTSWEAVALLCVKLGIRQGQLSALDTNELMLQATWKNPETRAEFMDAQTATLLRDLGVSQRTLLTERGYDPDQEQAYRSQETDTLNEAAGKLLDSGDGADGLFSRSREA